MSHSLFDEMKRFEGFTDCDSALLRELRPLAEQSLHHLLDLFYETLLQYEGTRRVLTEGEEQIVRLKKTLKLWVITLLTGPYNEEYYQQRSRIGKTHVKIKLDQHYMFAAMNLIRNWFHDLILREFMNDPVKQRDLLRAVNKILDIELAIMLESFRENFIEQLKQGEQLGRIGQLATIGELASSVAHEVGNSLAGISGALQVIRADFDKNGERRKIIDEIFRRIDRSKAVIEDLLEKSRGQGEGKR
ncbi:MAG: hypothetical protein HY731_09130 [Candidatus Tectomicrobia bacterium]|nr:hypothetical protein [Candidatus Tectomicrobia bacterium]